MSVRLMRSQKNPLLVPSGNWWEKKGVFNPATFIFEGKIHLLYRAVGSIGVSSFGLVRLKDPETIEERLNEPILISDGENEYERLGIEDPRVVKIDERYFIVYVAASLKDKSMKNPPSWSRSQTPWRIRVSLASTLDFKTITHHGVILDHIDSKNATLFPEKINGQYVLLHRVFPDIWISFSEDIYKLEKGSVLCSPQEGMWDDDRIGIGSQPLKTEKGWLIFYNGVTKREKSFKYMIGILLLDLNDPTKILYRSDEPILEPEEDYEKVGNTPNVIFTCGAIEWDGVYYVYYGGGDRVVAVASIEKKTLFDNIKSDQTSS